MRSRLSTLMVLLLLPSLAFAESSPEARKWVEKMLSIYDQGGFRGTYTLKMQVDQMGMQMQMQADGRLVVKDRRTMSNDMDITMTGMPQMPEGMEMTMRQVADGTTYWMQMTMSMMPAPQVMRIGIDEAEALGEELGTGPLFQTQDPLSQMRMLTEMFDFEVAGIERGEVTLRTRPTEKFGAMVDSTMADTDAEQKQAASDFVQRMGEMTMVLDEKTGFPLRMSAGGEAPVLEMEFAGFERVKAADLDASLFRYSPPEGVQVMDLGQMMKARPDSH